MGRYGVGPNADQPENSGDINMGDMMDHGGYDAMDDGMGDATYCGGDY